MHHAWMSLQGADLYEGKNVGIRATKLYKSSEDSMRLGL
jgi:hypothetical protein